MTDHPRVSALRVSNEAFLVASTIERCPKTMMLRELVMNALEAAADAPGGRREVEIRVSTIDGAAKLSIWNTGPGMDADELFRICDLASSLHKENSLDRNFGMGAKVASLPSNKHGLRYRSCRDGVVSEITLGQRDGVYGRLSHGGETAPFRAHDVTARCLAEGPIDLASDWTEVVLFGNRPEQDTALAPYDGNPAVPPDWIGASLSRRFYRLPGSAALGLGAELTDGHGYQRFRPLSERVSELTRSESVAVPAGITVHYGYEAPERDRTPSAASASDAVSGLAGVVHRGEIYGLREGQAWVLEAPTYGFAFGARHCSVFVELPDEFGVRPEAYRQFLRFQDGDQRQVLLVDVAALVRTHIPLWLRDIIASHGPAREDYAGAVTEELRALLIELGVKPQFRDATAPRGAKRKDPAPPKPPKTDAPPPSLRFEKPPEIISLRDEALIEERGLAGRAARYYPDSHEMFFNVTYPAVTRMSEQLAAEFTAAPDQDRMREVVAELSAWAITRKVARSLVYTLGKKPLGWTAEEVARAQSPESLSVAADDYAGLLDPVRRRAAEMLGFDLLVAEGASPAKSWTQRLNGEWADAHQAARRAMASPNVKAVPFLRRVSEIEMRRGNTDAAVDWAEKAVAADPSDAWCHNLLAETLQRKGELARAEAAARTALELGAANPAPFLRQLSQVLAQQRRFPEAIALARQATAESPTDAWLYIHLASLLQRSGDLDGAAAALRTGLAEAPGGRSAMLRQLSEIAGRRGQRVEALDLAREAVATDEHDVWAQNHLASLLLDHEEYPEAEAVILTALVACRDNPAPLLRTRSNLEVRRKNLERAIEFGREAVEAAPQDPWGQMHVSGLLLQSGDLEGAEQACKVALGHSGGNAAPFLRRASEIQVRRRHLPAALLFAQQAVTAEPHNPKNYDQLASVLLHMGDVAQAEHAARHAVSIAGDQRKPFLWRLSDIQLRRKDISGAIASSQMALESDPTSVEAYNHLSRVQLQVGELFDAERTVKQALAVTYVSPSP